MRRFIITTLIIAVCIFMLSCDPDNNIIEINFDDIIAPTLFGETTALRETYLFLGVYFSSDGTNGGAILDEGSEFGVTGHSSPNFLAFNSGSVLQDSGIPEGPETIYFTNTVNEISMNAGNVNAGFITVTAYDEDDTEIATDTMTGNNELTTITLEGIGIKYVVVEFTGNLLIIDDIIAYEE